MAEDTYFNNLDYAPDGIHLKNLQSYPGPGELHIGFGIGPAASASAVPVYLLEPNLTDRGRAEYAKGLETCLRTIGQIQDEFRDSTRMERLKSSVFCALDDVINIAYARETAKRL